MPHSLRPAEAAEAARALRSNVERTLRGKPEVVRRAVETLIAGGHLLLEDVPGVGKTTLAHALARSVDASFRRIQFTSDLLPGDILGVSVPEFNDGRRPSGSFAIPARARSLPTWCWPTRSTAPAPRRSPPCSRR